MWNITSASSSSTANNTLSNKLSGQSNELLSVFFFQRKMHKTCSASASGLAYLPAAWQALSAACKQMACLVENAAQMLSHVTCADVPPCGVAHRNRHGANTSIGRCLKPQGSCRATMAVRMIPKRNLPSAECWKNQNGENVCSQEFVAH